MKIKWNIIKLKDNKFLIQNVFSKNFLELVTLKTSFFKYYNPICSNNISSDNYNNASDAFKFSFLKLFEEVELKPEHIEIIEKEPIDVLIKYIDLSDKTLNREGIIHIKKDEEHGEIRYCVRSILENIPWIRKIFILMPNERVKYFKPIEEISDKFVYVKDKDFLGFESENSNVFQYNLYKMSNFGLSENFILMDDDYFIGKPIKKTDFFYYDEQQKKVLPSLINDYFYEINENNIKRQYYYFKYNKENINVHSSIGFRMFRITAYKLMIDNFKPPLINAEFTHNAIPLNLNDMKEIYDLIIQKYEDINKTLNSLKRTPYDIQTQLLSSLYLLNIKKRKVKRIPYAYYDIKDLKNQKVDEELFVINTSGNRLYRDKEYKFAKLFLEKRFNKPTKYETFFEEINLKDEEKEKNEENKKNEEKEENEEKKENEEKFLKEMAKKYFEIQNQTIKILVNKISENKELIQQQKILIENMNKKYNNLLSNFINIVIISMIVIIVYILSLIYKIAFKKIKFHKYFEKKAYKSNELNIGEESVKINNDPEN